MVLMASGTSVTETCCSTFPTASDEIDRGAPPDYEIDSCVRPGTESWFLHRDLVAADQQEKARSRLPVASLGTRSASCARSP